MSIVYWHWWIFACILLILELLLPGVFFLWSALAAGVTGIVLFVLPGLNPAHQISVFAVASVVGVSGWRFYLRGHPQHSEEPLLNQRLSRYTGRTATLTDPIVNGSGRVRLDDTLWKVVGPDCPAGTQVRVTGAEDMVLRVEVVEK